MLYELPLLRMRALLASAQGDQGRYRSYVDRYLMMAQAVQFEGVPWRDCRHHTQRFALGVIQTCYRKRMSGW